MEYLMLIKHAENVDVRNVPQALMDAMGTLVTEGLKRMDERLFLLAAPPCQLPLARSQ